MKSEVLLLTVFLFCLNLELGLWHLTCPQPHLLPHNVNVLNIQNSVNCQSRLHLFVQLHILVAMIGAWLCHSLWFMDVNVSSIHHLNYPHWTSHYLTNNQVCFKIVHCSWKVFTLSNHLLMVLKTTLGNKSVFPNQSEGWSVWKGLQMYIVISISKQKQKVRGL